MIMFPPAKTTNRAKVEQIDINSAFCSADPIFHEWCLDYFNYKWENSKTFDSKKLLEV